MTFHPPSVRLVGKALLTAACLVVAGLFAAEVTAAEGARPAAGGSDNIGAYSWVDSDAPDGPEEAWQDISETGESLPLGDQDFDFHEVDLDFSFTYYQQSWDSVFVSEYGMLTFGAGATYPPGDEPLPYIFAPANTIAPFWAVLDVAMGGKVYFQSFEDYAIVQFDSVRFLLDQGRATFQVVLYADGSFEYRYQSFSGPTDDGIIGWQRDYSVGATIALKEEYIYDGLTILVTPNAAGRRIRIDVDPDAGVGAAIDGGSPQPVPVDFDGLGVGVDHLIDFEVIQGEG